MNHNKNYEKDLKRIAKLYDKRASSADNIKAAGQWGTKELAKEITNEIHKKIKRKQFNNILEIGCGTGVLGETFLNKCSNYVGFDASFVMLKKFFATNNNKPNLMLANVVTIPCKKNIFDLVLMNSVTMYFPNEEFFLLVINEIRRVTKNNAIIFIGDNIIPSRYCWELIWFEKLSPFKQSLAKPYIKLRKWLAAKYSPLAGKWKFSHKDISPKFLEKSFIEIGNVQMSDAAAFSIRKKLYGKNVGGNRRVDFVIELRKDTTDEI